MVSRFVRWYEEHPLPGDAALAAALLLAFALPTDLSADTGVAADVAFSTALIACLPGAVMLLLPAVQDRFRRLSARPAAVPVLERSPA